MNTEAESARFAQAVEPVGAPNRDGYPPEGFILLGAHARGAAAPDSDLDLLIVKSSDRSEAERIRQVSRLLRPRLLPLDILVKTPGEIQERLAIKDSFFQEILREGKVLYDREGR